MNKQHTAEQCCKTGRRLCNVIPLTKQTFELGTALQPLLPQEAVVCCLEHFIHALFLGMWTSK